MKKREQRVGWLRILARVAEPRNAVIVLVAVGALFATAVWESRDRVVGTLQPGAPELRPESRFNRDAVAIASGFDVGLDWLSVVVEAPADSCDNPAVGTFDDQLADSLQTRTGRGVGRVLPGDAPSVQRGLQRGQSEA